MVWVAVVCERGRKQSVYADVGLTECGEEHGGRQDDQDVTTRPTSESHARPQT